MSKENGTKPLKQHAVIGSVTSIYETYSTKELKEKLLDVSNEIEALQTTMNTIENIIFYRENPECK